jgi:hypothetical protein
MIVRRMGNVVPVIVRRARNALQNPLLTLRVSVGASATTRSGLRPFDLLKLVFRGSLAWRDSGSFQIVRAGLFLWAKRGR